MLNFRRRLLESSKGLPSINSVELKGTDRIEWNSNFGTVLPSVQIKGNGHQDSFPKITAQTGGIVTMPNLDPGRPLKVTTDILPQQEGSGDPSPENVRNFKEITAADVTVCGGNLAESVQYRQVTGNYNPLVIYGYGSRIARLKIGEQYTISISIDADGPGAIAWNPLCGIFYRKDMTVAAGLHRYEYTFTALQEFFNKTTILSKYGSDGYAFTPSDICLIEGDRSPYQPYIGTTHTATFDPIYGGRVDWNKGVVESMVDIGPISDSEWTYLDSPYEKDMRFVRYLRGGGDINKTRPIVSEFAKYFVEFRDAMAWIRSGTDHIAIHLTNKYAALVMVSEQFANSHTPGEVNALGKTMAWIDSPPTIPATISTPPVTISGVNNIYSSTGPVTASASAGPSPDFRVEPTWAEKTVIGLRGRNLAPNLPDWEGERNGIRHIVKNGIVFVSGTADGYSVAPMVNISLPKGRYTLSGGGWDSCYFIVRTWMDGKYTYWTSDVTITGQEEDITFYYQINPGVTVDGYFYPMINVGDSAYPYELFYDGGIASIPIIRAIGDIRDEIEIRDGKIIKNIDEFIVTGNEMWFYDFDKKAIWMNIENRKDNSPVICNTYMNSKEEIKDGLITYGVGNPKSIWICDKKLTDLGKAKKFFNDLYKNNNPIKIWYQLDRPVEEQDKACVFRQKTFYNQIIKLNGELPVEISAKVYPAKEVRE